MKLVKENINEMFTQNSDPIKDMGINKLPKPKFNYNNLFIAVRDIKYTNHKGTILVPRGTVLIRTGGGMMANFDRNIIIGNITKINGKKVYSYDISKDDDNYVEIYYNIPVKTFDLIENIKDFFTDLKSIENLAKNLDINAIEDNIKNRLDILHKIRELLK